MAKASHEAKEGAFLELQLDVKGTNQKLYIQRDVEFNKSDFNQKSAVTTEPDQKSMEVKQNADITAKGEEQVAEIRRSEKDEE